MDKRTAVETSAQVTEAFNTILRDINAQLLHLRADKHDEEIKSLNGTKSCVLSARARLTEYYERKAKVFTGKIKYLDHNADVWVGKVNQPGHEHHDRMVMVRRTNLGPGEELVNYAGNIMVKSYSKMCNPPYIVMS